MIKRIFLLFFLTLAISALAAPDSLNCRMIDWLDVPGLDWRISNSDMAMGDSFLVWCPGRDIYYLINPFSQSEIETTFSKDYGSANVKGVCINDSLTYMVGGGGVCSFRFRNDSLFLAGFDYTAWASFHYAVIRDTFLYTASPGSYGLHCINIANPESIFAVCSAPAFFGVYGMEVIDSFAYCAGLQYEEIGAGVFRPEWRMSMVKLIGDTSAVGESLVFVENRGYGDITTDGEHLFYVNNYLSNFVEPDYQLLGEARLGIWGEDYSYTWEDPDSEIVFGIEVLNDIILAVGFDHGLSILNYENLDSIYQVAYYRDLDSTFRLTHFAMKDNRLYAMGHPRDYVSRMFMFDIDEDVWASIEESPNPAKPSAFTISAHPNPFNSAVTITALAGAEI